MLGAKHNKQVLIVVNSASMEETSWIEDQIASLTNNMMKLMKSYEDRDVKLDLLLNKSDLENTCEKIHQEYEE